MVLIFRLDPLYLHVDAFMNNPLTNLYYVYLILNASSKTSRPITHVSSLIDQLPDTGADTEAEAVTDQLVVCCRLVLGALGPHLVDRADVDSG